MKLYVLQVTVGQPRQFRITVVEAAIAVAGSKPAPEPGWVGIGVYDTPDELETALAPYLHMEIGV